MTKKKDIRLTSDLKLWLYQNIRKSLKSDPYLKNFDADIMLAEFKYELRVNDSLNLLLFRLKELNYDVGFKFFRKISDNKPLYFDYPSLCFQIETLFESWKSIVDIEKKFISEYKNLYSESDLLFLLDDEYESKEKEGVNTSQFVYGLRPNLKTYYELDYEKASLKDYELSKISSIKCNFQREYDHFRKKVKTKSNEIAKTGTGVFFQTDIKSFYHTIKPAEILKFLNINHPQSYGLIASVQRLKKAGYKELPVGWLMSSFIAYLILFEFHRKLKEGLKKIDLGIDDIKIHDIQILSYVDDFVFLYSTSRNLSKEEKVKLAKKTLSIASVEMQKNLGFKGVNFHHVDSDKTVLFDLTPSFASIVETNFFNFANNDYANDGWHALEEIMAPFDNDLILNDRVQFLKRLNNARSKILEDDLDENFSFDQIFSMIQFKLEKTGGRYLGPILSLLGQYFKYCMGKNTFNKVLFEKYATILCESIDGDKKLPVNIWINLFEKLWQTIPNKKDKEIIESFKNLLKKFSDHELNSRNEWSLADIDLFKMLKIGLNKKIGFTNYPEMKPQRESDDRCSFKLGFIFLRNVYIEEIIYSDLNNIKLQRNDLYSIAISMREIYSLNPENFSFFNVVAKISSSFKGRDQKMIILHLVEESAFYFFPRIKDSDLKNVYKLLEEKELHEENIARELIFQIENYQTINQFAALDGQDKLDAYMISMQSYFNEKKENPLKGIVGDFEFYHTKKMLVKSFVWTNFFYMTVNIEEFWRILFFKYTKIDSALALNWSASPFSLNNASFVVGKFLKKILELNYKLDEINLIKKIQLFLKKSEMILKVENNERLEKINLDDILNKFYKKNYDFSQGVKITIAPLKIVKESYELENALVFKEEYISAINSKVNAAISHAIKQKSNFIVFPEMSLPRKYLAKYLEKAGRGGLIVVGGVENRPDRNKFVSNDVVISFPCIPSESPMGKYYWPFFQSKIFPSTKEYNVLIKAGFNFKFGGKMVLFTSKKWNNFSILNCADFLSLELAFYLQGYVQTLIVPSMNYDSETFNHLSNTYIRQLFCYCVISNNRAYGGSSVLAPFRDKFERNVFNIEGDSVPEFHTLKIYPNLISQIQDENYLRLFQKEKKKEDEDFVGKFKQLPPGWKKKII